HPRIVLGNNFVIDGIGLHVVLQSVGLSWAPLIPVRTTVSFVSLNSLSSPPMPFFAGPLGCHFRLVASSRIACVATTSSRYMCSKPQRNKRKAAGLPSSK